MTVNEILAKLEALGSPENIAGMARFAIVTDNVFGVSGPQLKQLAKEIKKATKDRHSLALELWETGVYEARAIAYLIDDPKEVTEDQMDAWAAAFDNWAIVDGTCGHLFCRSPLARTKIEEWSACDEEFIKRAGIVLIAWLAVHDKKASDDEIAAYLPLLEKYAADDRNFVKKAVNWSLRQIGKRSLFLNGMAVETADRIRAQGSKPARWIASDALRELTGEKVQQKLRDKLAKQKEKSLTLPVH